MIEKFKNKIKIFNFKEYKIKWFGLFTLVLMLLVVFPITSYADIWWEVDDKALAFLTKYQNGLQFTKGGFMSIALQSVSWGIIRGAYFISNSLEKLIRNDVLTLFGFVESAGLSRVYQTVLNTIVLGLMILSLVFIGYKWVLGKGNIDLKSVGMNIVMSVSLILLMPTMINSGIKFAEGFYKDTTSINRSDSGVAWTLIENGVTDLVYINKNKVYNRLPDENGKFNAGDKNALKEKNFYSYDFSEIITTDTAKKLENDNPQAKYLTYRLTPDGDGNMRAVKIDDGFMAMFSDSFKGGYYRYTKNTFTLMLSLIALAIAYVLSAFVIIGAILELAFKRVLGVLVFATDLESGQRSKMVLSDILQCYLLVGFQGFGLSMFALTVSYLEGVNINVFIKAIAYVSAVFVLLKGSNTVMRYFGVDIGLKEGYGQLASSLGMGMALARKAGSVGGLKGNGKEGGGSEGEERKPEKNFGESLSEKAKKLGAGAGYAKERGLSGLASDGASSVGNQVARPFRAARDLAEGTGRSLQDGFNQGTAEAVKKGMKPTTTSSQEKEFNPEQSTRLSQRQDQARTQGIDGNSEPKVMSSSERMRLAEQNQSNVRDQATQDLKQRIIKASEGETNKAREEFIQQRRSEAKYNPVSGIEERMSQAGRSTRSPETSEVQERLSQAGRSTKSSETSEVQERLSQAGRSTRSPETSEVQERLNQAGRSTRSSETSEVQERLNQAGRSTRSPETAEVQERLNQAGRATRSPEIAEVQERVNQAGRSTRSSETAEVQERLNQAGRTTRSSETAEVQERINQAGRATRSSETAEVQERINQAGRATRSSETAEVQERVNQAGRVTRSSETAEVQERLNQAGRSTRSPEVMEVQEKTTSSRLNHSQTVDVNYQTTNSPSFQNQHTTTVQEQVIPANRSTGQSERVVNVQEKTSNTTSSQPIKTQTVDVNYRATSSPSFQNQQTVDVRSNVVSDGDLTQKMNIVEKRQTSAPSGNKKESIVVEKEVKETTSSRSRYVIEGNPLFQEPRRDNPLFNFDK